MLEIQSPTRVDLAGGTLDCWPLYLLFGSCTTLNLPVSVWTRASLEELSSPIIQIESRDIQLKVEAENLPEFLKQSDPQLRFFQIVLEHFKPSKGFRLTTRSESPVGAGLGGSSSMLMTLLKLFSHWLGQALPPDQMVRLASSMEAQMLRKPTGTQDYFPAIYSKGLNVIHYSNRDPRVEVLPIPSEVFHKRFLLVYTGRSHNSGINNWDVIKKAIEGDSPTMRALEQIRQIADEMAEHCRRQYWSALPELFRKETIAREALSDSFTSPEIRKLIEIANKEGADAVKICGAGGGGCVFIWTPENRFEKVKAACQKQRFSVLDAKPLV